MKVLRILTYAVLATASILTILLLNYVSSDDISLVSRLIWCGTFGLWCISPNVCLAVQNRVFRKSALQSLVLLIAAIVISLFSAWAMINGFFINLDPQSAVLLIFVPVYQWAGALLALLFVFAISLIRSQRNAGRT